MNQSTASAVRIVSPGVGATAARASSAGPLSRETMLDQHPYGALAAALGAGYVLGGGFFTQLTARIVRFAVRVGVRAALVRYLTAQLSQLVTPAKKKDASTTSSDPSSDRASTTL